MKARRKRYRKRRRAKALLQNDLLRQRRLLLAAFEDNFDEFAALVRLKLEPTPLQKLLEKHMQVSDFETDQIKDREP